MGNDRELLMMAQVGYVALLDHYQKRIEEIERELNPPEPPNPAVPSRENHEETPHRKRFSVATRAKMRASQRARWATRKVEKMDIKPARTMSAKARKAISDFQKARWRRIRAAQPKTMAAGE